jgi:ankyrin repeat protein
MEQRADCVKLLLDAGADVRASDAGGMSVLHWAGLYGDVELVKLLVSKGAEAWALNVGRRRPHEVMTANDPRASSSLSYSVLTKAVIKKQVNIVEAYLTAVYNRGRGLNRAALAVNFSSKGRSFSPGALSPRNSPLASFLSRCRSEEQPKHFELSFVSCTVGLVLGKDRGAAGCGC